jgi:thiol-disulfide isomerase/thioredoxin
MQARFLLTVLLLAPLAGCLGPEGASPGDGAPAWSFTDTEGMVHARDAPEGNATVLFFMATWCGTCVGKAPMLAEVHDEYADRGVRFYSLDFDATETPDQIRTWKERRDQPWPHGVDPGLAVQRAFGVTSQSSVVVLDGSGRVVESWGYGAVTGPALRAALDRALSPSPTPAAA